MARQKRSPNFKGHHFSSLAAHKELELFLRENLSNNFGCCIPGKSDSSQAVWRNDACLDSEPWKEFLSQPLDPHIKVMLISRVLSKYSN